MADEPLQPRPDDETPDAVGAPFEEETESAAPRRAASAEFVVDAQIGTQAALREAMDPANQSLAEALRLSFRVLQVVILVLVVLFVLSGVQTVRDNQSGALLRWGKIISIYGNNAGKRGIKFSRWPYPAGEFVLFDDTDRRVDLGGVFWPNLEGTTLEKAIGNASVRDRLAPGKDGMLLTRDGEIAHIRLETEYRIDFPDSYLHCVEDRNADPTQLDADRLVRLAVQRAAVHFAARHSLQEIVDLGEVGRLDMLAEAQRFIDFPDRADLSSGITLGGLETPIDPTPALAIKRAYGQFQEAKVQAQEQVKNARQDANNVLISTAGQHYARLVSLIDEYETALELHDAKQSGAVLDQINARLESEETTGEVTAVLGEAKSYRSAIEQSLGLDAKRFKSLLPRYRETPALVLRQLWAKTMDAIFQAKGIEIYLLPREGAPVRISLVGQERIREERRRQMLDRKETEALIEGLDTKYPVIRRGSDMHEGPGRTLSPTGAKGLGGRP